MKPDVFPLNAPGDFYVLNQCCIACGAPEIEAPDLMAHDHSNHCYFKRQPATTEETDRAILAIAVGCCRAVRYGGHDQEIIDRLIALGSKDECDYAPPINPYRAEASEEPRPKPNESALATLVTLGLATACIFATCFFLAYFLMARSLKGEGGMQHLTIIFATYGALALWLLRGNKT